MELMVNDNWEDSQKQLITDLWGGNPPLPAGSLSSAAVLTLEPGNYTAKVEGKNGTAGVAIVEVLGINSPGADGKFVNLSTRALVETGEEVMIGGFIIGEDSKEVLIQAVGPELANAGITNALADPVLTITDTTDPGNPMELTVNDNWEDSQGQLVSDLWGGSPNLVPGSLSSAAVLTLEPGNYTAKVEGKNGTTGVAIVEVYDVDAPDAETGHAPADQAAFDALVVGKQIGSDANNRLVFLSSGRIREIEDGTPYEGNYKYENTGANTGTLTYTYDATDNDPAAEKTVIEMTFTSEGAGTLVSTYTEAGSRPEVISGPFELADTDGGPPDSTDYKPLEGLRVSRGRVQFGFSRTGGCIRMANTTINGVNYTSHGSEWQRRAEADSPWADVPGTEEEGGLCALDPTEPGEYRMIADITIDGTRGRYSSENTFTITVEPPDTMPSFATGSGPGNQTYTVGTAIDTLILPEAIGGDGTLTYSLSPSVAGLAFNARARQLTGRPTTAGTYNMTYTVRDGDGDTDTLSFTIWVEESDDDARVDWVFAGDVPEAHQTALREEMAAVRTWFAERYGVEATGFTVLVGADSEALTQVYKEIVGPRPLPYSPLGISVETAENGSAVILVDFSGGVSFYGEEALSIVRNSIIHEYFHVLQGQLASGFRQVSASKLAFNLGQGPFWLVEGLAQYADYLYTQSRPGRPSFLDHNTPYERMADAIGQGALTFGDLVNLEDQGNLQGGLAHPLFTYPMAFLASTLLVDQADEGGSIVNYWQLLHDRPTWQQAFVEAFGIGIEDFYETFEEWLPSQLPLRAYLSVWLRWPGRDTQASDTLNPLLWKTTVVPEFTTDSPSGIASSGGTSADGANIISYPSETTIRAYLSLRWESDSCTENILGWYKDGELTDQKGEATVVEFPDISSSLEWELPAQPDNLPRLSQQTRPNCTP